MSGNPAQANRSFYLLPGREVEKSLCTTVARRVGRKLHLCSIALNLNRPIPVLRRLSLRQARRGRNAPSGKGPGVGQ